MQLDILTPEGSLFSGNVDSMFLPGELGNFQILKDHMPIVSSLKEGKVKFILSEKKGNLNKVFSLSEGKSDLFELSIKGGVIEFHNNNAIVLVEGLG